MSSPGQSPSPSPATPRIPPSLRAYWFIYLSGLGIFQPFYTLYLRENAGLSGAQVGIAAAIIPLVGLVAQPFWGRIADRLGARARALTLVSTAASILYALPALASDFSSLLLTLGALAFFSTATLPLATSVTLAALGSLGARGFGVTRAWGTAGFLVSVALFPRFLTWLEGWIDLGPARAGIDRPGLAAMFPATALLCLLGTACTLAIPRGGDESLRAQRGDWRELVASRPFVLLLLCVLLGYFFIQGPLSIFPLLISARGGGLDTTSLMWIFMLSVEIPLVRHSGFTMRWLGPSGLLSLGIFAGGLRWLLTGAFEDPLIVYPAQLLHGVAVAGLHVGSALYVDALVPAKLRSSAQGLLGMVSVSIGGILSNLAAGAAFDRVGPVAPYIVGGLGGMALGLWIWLRPLEAQRRQPGA